ncbi:Sulfotransferase family protein [Desulfocicer vacuolatum DSM 3385]|uniref:Sulfotransferase family protein n=1 Tax=Desulfocicer vacuolatum DSM 3385 TaxID=1121400 RepID=A0A1W2CXX3_9BACT|nr:sulfotransferase [Desulfocicer vacuolatum]SMC90010.1 Sulfotransferase family protein [Desulfocicer vacuolatum DSM 3385]
MFNRKLRQHIYKISKRNILTTYRELGLSRVAVATGMYLWMLLVRFSMVLDQFFFPNINKINIKQPIFIMGAGRTGSTFLYRLINRHNDYVASKFWHILIPSLTLRVLLHPLIHFIERKESNVNYEVLGSGEGHKTTLTTFEEDEMVLGHIMDTQHLSFSTSLGLHPDGFDELVYHDQQPHRREAVKFLKAYLQRQIKFLKKNQVISKAVFSTFRLKTLLEIFPDAKFIHLIRSPLDAIPSHMTLHKKVSEKFNPGVSSQAISTFLKYRYRYNCEALLQFENLRSQGIIDEKCFLEIRYEDLRDNLEMTMNRIVDFTGINVDKDLQAHWEKQARRQKSYKPNHVNLSFEMLEITPELIQQDLKQIFEKYNFKTNDQ